MDIFEDEKEEGSLANQIVSKLSPVEKFVVKAKHFGDFELLQKTDECKIYMDYSHIMALNEGGWGIVRDMEADMKLVTVDLKLLRQILLAFQRNGATTVDLHIGKNFAMGIAAPKDVPDVKMMLAPRVNPDDDDEEDDD